MESSARLVTIKRSGDDGAHFPLSLSSCLFGRSIECDIRIQLPVVSKKHCKIEVNEQQAILYNFSSTNPTQVNGATIDEPVQLKHGDIITIIDRSFRYENGNHEDGSRSAGFPGRSSGQEPARRAWRASFPVDSDGKDQDAKASKTTASRRSLVHAKRLPGDNSASDGSKDSVIQDPLNTEQHCSSNICEPTSGDLIKKSRATGNSYRELKSSPALSLCNSKKNESPFKNLYQSMKEELDIKSQKQSRRKSEPQPECVAGKDTWETKLLACKSRPKSSGSTPGTATSSPRVEKMGTEKKSSGVGPVETSTEALSSSFSPSETAKVKTPVRNSQQLKNEDLLVIGKRDPVILNESEGAQVVHKIVTPRKLGTRNQTAVKVEDAASPGGTPENISSKKRRRISAEVEALPAETQSRFSSTQPLTPGEKKTPKDSFSKSEKVATATEQICSGLPGLSSVDISNFDKSEGMSLKRRRVSFGGHLRPELFDENLPPNTPLKRGETPTKRKSLTTHTPAVLKKIIKEWRQSPGKHESPGITPPRASDQRCKSDKSSSAFSGSESLHQTDIPKKAGRKSGNLPAKRASISRSQHDILQMICSKRRSGASEANLIVAKSWADVVKLGTKQTQTKVVKHIPQKQMSKRQRRPNTPKKPASNLPNQFSTGHANSPCTIVIGRAQIEKVSMPARPYKMLNNLVLNRKMDFSEDLSGLTEMFKTPGKEKQQQMDDMNLILSTSDNLPEKQFQVTKSGGKPLPITSEILGENVLSSTQNASKEPSDIYFASPTLRRKSIKNGNTGQTPKNIHNTNPLEKKTPGSVTEPLKTVSSVSKLRRSRELIHTLVESMNENTEADHAEGIKQRHLRKTSLERQEVDQEKTSTMRSSAREQKPTKDLIGGIQMVTQTLANAEELLNQSQEKGITEKPKESEHIQNTPIGDGHRATKQKVDRVYASKEKHWPRTPDQKTQTLEGPVGLKEPFETPNCREKLTDKTKVFCKSAQPTTENMKTSKKEWSGLSGSKVDVKKEDSFGRKFVHTSGGTRHTPKVSKLEHGNIRALKESENQMLDLTVTGSKRTVGKANEKTQPLDNLASFQELFLSPGSSDKITKMPNKSTCSELVRTPASTKRLSKTGPGKVDEKEVHSTLGKRTKSPGRATRTPTAPLLEEHDNTAFMETPKQKLDFTGNSTGHKRRSRTSKIRAEPLEDLDGFQELFQTPAGASDPVTVGVTAEVPLECPQPEAVRTPVSTKRLSKTGLGKVDIREKLSPLNKLRCSAPEVGHASRLSDNGRGTKDLMEPAAQTSDPAVRITRSKRNQGTCKKSSLASEDLFCLQEPFKTSGHDKDSGASDKLTEMPHRSSPPEPVDASETSERQLRTRRMKIHVKNELSGDRMLPKMLKEIMDISGVPEVEDKGIRTRKQSVKRKLDTAVSMSKSKRQRVARAENAQTLMDLPGFQELYQTPSLAVDSVNVDITTKMPSKSPEPMDTISETQPGRRLRRVGVTKEPIAQRQSTRVLRETRNTRKEPMNNSKGIKDFKEFSVPKEDPAGSLTGKRSQSRALKKTQPLEELPSIQEETATRISCESPQPEEKETSAASKRQLKIQLCKVGIKEEPTAQRKPPGRATRNTLKEPMSDSADVEELKESKKQKIDPAASVPVSKRPQRVPREKAQPLELAGLKEPVQIPGHTEELASNKRSTQMPCKPLQPEQVHSLQTSPRCLRTRRGKVEVSEEPSVVRETVPTLRQTTRSRKVHETDDKDTQASKEPAKQKLEKVANETGSRRQLRALKDEVPPLEVLGDSKKLAQISVHTEKLGHDTSNLKSTLQQMPDSTKPLRTCRRVLRASKEDTVETMELPVNIREPVESQSKSNTVVSPKRKSARDKSISRARGLRSVTAKQEESDEKPAPKKQKAVSSKMHMSPEPLKMKHLRIMSSKIEPLEEQISNIIKTEEKEVQVENSAPADQKMGLSSRYRKKTNGRQPRPEVGVSAETVQIKKNEMTMKTSQETELQNTDDGTKKSTSKGKVSGKRTCLRSRGQSEIPQPQAAEEKTSETNAEILIKTQKEKEISEDSDVRCLRSRKTGATLDSEPKPRVTRGAKKDTKVPKKDEDIVYTKKLRTRSHQNSKNM